MILGFSQLELLIALFAMVAFGLLLLIGLLVRSGGTKRQAAQWSQTQQSLEQMLSVFQTFQSNQDDKRAKDQQQLFNTLSQDRERQLAAITELRVELERRFADSGMSLSNTINEFKSQMVDKFEQLQRSSANSLAEGQQNLTLTVNRFGEKIAASMEAHQNQTRESIVDNIRKGIHDLRSELDRSIKNQNEAISKSIGNLTDSTDNRLKEISGQVEKRLTEGFDKTTKTFNDVLKRLALIDDAQKKITELSTNVVSLQEILNDKRSRGAFGEVQLLSLVSNIMPDSHYTMQQKLSNEKIADCLLKLPEPTGNIAIDAKFPLESYKKMTDVSVADSDRKVAARQFSKDVKKHINDIADKYIIPPETSDGAVMFIPAESVFAEIHGHYPEIIEFAYTRKVWLVSPTTLMAILTTASTVIKDEQTRKQVHIIQEHLSSLGKDFVRFQGRMDNLSKHIGQVSKDVEQVHTSAKKISSRFEKIENVEIPQEEESKPRLSAVKTDRLEEAKD